MSVLIIGGDNLGKIPAKLTKLGAELIRHTTGRKCKNCVIPSDTDMILVLTDYVNHNLCEMAKCNAKKCQIPILFSRRSWSCIYKKLEFTNLIQKFVKV
ncbi:DUF2325 domain-containing protein [Natroniella acetigena]|uniref:DUF2325 domain-containing protein n=1 Tax=Natroniella acetigena TaxID=52004 RepID=UPI002009ECFF|nr:DUF2325 domain-containing protein [Natroniella acetigena]MCK8826677.1 DUF2325 domain-containing protein [Natroniella acetigena]